MPGPNSRPPGPLGQETPISSVPTYATTTTTQWGFTGLSRDAVERGVEARFRRPQLIAQKGSSLCGPAAFMYILAKHRRLDYATYVMDLYDHGTARIGDLVVQPGKACKEAGASKIGMDPADWVALAGLRDSENLLADYDDPSDEAAGITFPMTLRGWMKAAGFRDTRKEVLFTVTNTKSNFMDALALHARGFEVCLLIDDEVIRVSPKKRSFFEQLLVIPRHWVVLSSVQSTDPTDLRFTVYTWGVEPYQVPHVPGAALTMEIWLQSYFGYVACKP